MILSVDNLDFTYPGAGRQTLNSLCFEIHEGEVFGFLGPNGSGKSTTQKILTRILTGFGGEVRAFGSELSALGQDYYNRIGVCFEFPNLYDKLTAEENLEFYRRFFDVPTREPSDLLHRLDLPVGDRKVAGQYSKGMKMRLVLARSLLNNPKLWFLDEPTSGQDPQHSVLIRELIRRERERGATVFLTTHNMNIADELCDRVAFIVDGRVALVDSPRELRLKHSQKSVRVEYTSLGKREAKEFSLSDQPGREGLISLLSAEPNIESIHSMEPSLEDVFLNLTGRRLSDQ